MGTFQIDAVDSGFRSWSPPDKPNLVFNYYTIRFAGEEGKGEADLKRPANEPPPTVNEVLEGYEIVNKPGRRAELKKVGAGGRPSGAKTGDFRTPEQIIRSDAHGKAMHWCDIKNAAGDADKVKALTWEQYLVMVDRFYLDLKGAS